MKFGAPLAMAAAAARKSGHQRGRRKRLGLDGHERQVAQVLNFSGIQQVTHDHRSGDGPRGIAIENRPGIHQGRAAGKIENSRHLAGYLSSISEQRAGLEMIVQARRNVVLLRRGPGRSLWRKALRPWASKMSTKLIFSS